MIQDTEERAAEAISSPQRAGEITSPWVIAQVLNQDSVGV